MTKSAPMSELQSGTGRPHRALTLLVGLATSGLTVCLALAVLSAPSGVEDVAGLVRDRLGESGVSNPVTAVLLNFRAYDTLLEIAVLVTALAATWALGPPAFGRSGSAGPVLITAMRWLGPVMVLIAGYLLWRGAFAPGGAFQAGAILAAVGVLWLTAGELRLRDGIRLRIAVAIGIVLFLGVAVGLMLFGDGFLTYRGLPAKNLILLIEAGAAISIGAILAALFVGGRPAPCEGQ